MVGGILFTLTILAYFALILVGLCKPNMTGDQSGIWGILVFSALGFYIVSTLLFTVSLTKNGKFDWLCNSTSFRSLLVGIGWLCMVAGVVHISMMLADSNSKGTQLFTLDKIMRYSIIWVPLLMLVPYGTLLKIESYNSVPAFFYKTPLLFGCIIGVTLTILNNSKRLQEYCRPNFESGKSMQNIENTENISVLLNYTSSENSKIVRETALNKLRSRDSLENGLKLVLDQSSENFYFINVLKFLEHNDLKHPEILLDPINHVILTMAENFEVRLGSYGSELEVIKILDVECLIHVLEKHYKTSKEFFLPNILKLQESLKTTPNQPEIIKVQTNYLKVVQSWLNTSR